MYAIFELFFLFPTLGRGESVRVDIFHGVAHGGEVLLKSFPADDDRSAAVIGVKTERLSILQTAVEEQYHMVLRVVDETEGTDAAGL